MQSIRSSWKQWWWLAPLAILLGIFFWAMNYTYPLIGHDFYEFIPSLLAGKWHYVRQGLSPFRFTPHFCGGLPQYGNPQDLSYSLPQLLTFFIDPWLAVQMSIGIALVAGYIGWFLVGRDLGGFNRAWAHLFALAVIANGFYLVHMVVGHFSFHTLPLLGWIFWLIFERRTTHRFRLSWRAALFALLSSIMLYSGGFFVLMTFAFMLVLFLPLDLLLTEPAHMATRWKELLRRVICCALVALLIGASKLIAIWSFMRFFPRMTPFDQLSADASMLLLMARAFFYIPQGFFLFRNAEVPWGVHEYSMFLSPAVLIGLLMVPLVLLRSRERKLRVLLVFLYLLLLTAFFAQLGRGSGVLIEPLTTIPILSSFHVTVRFVYLFSLFITFLGFWSLHALSSLTESKPGILFLGGFTLFMTLAGLPVAYYPLLQSNQLWRPLPYDEVQERVSQGIFLETPVKEVRDHSDDIEHVLSGTTAIHCYEALFGYKNEYQATSLTPGPVENVRDNAFNLNNPSCFQYPEENQCHPGDRIAFSDRENLERFTRGERTTWKLSRAQRLADGTSLLTLLLLLCSVLFHLGSSLFSLRKKPS